jgi:hypothetical protein
VIGGWLIKVLLGIAILGFAVVELGSPLVARAQADDAAHEVANEASFRLRDNFTDPVLQQACQDEATKQNVKVVECTFDQAKNVVVVKVGKHARSFLLDRFGATKDWYDVTATATAERR